jgi:hypothetical protein
VNVWQIAVSRRLRLKSIFKALFKIPLSNAESTVFSMYFAAAANCSEAGFPLRCAAR